MPRFVILRHEMPAGAMRSSHWDFMLERDGALRTWVIDELPSHGRAIAAAALADHRLAYLDYEGPVSGDRGSVTRYDSGEYELLQEAPGGFVIVLQGGKVQGRIALTRTLEAQWQMEMTPTPGR